MSNLLSNSFMSGQSTVDLTTIYSAEAALQNLEFDDPSRAWFTYSLSTLSLAIMRSPKVLVSKPPISNSHGPTPPGMLVSLLKDRGVVTTFSDPDHITRMSCVAITNEWLKQNQSHFDALARRKTFWSHPTYKTWLEWHKKHEWPGRATWLHDVSDPDFEDFVKSLGLHELEELYTMDALARGFYYRIVTEGDAWLHPLRILNLPPEAGAELVVADIADEELFLLVLASLRENTGTLSPDDRMTFWACRVAESREILSSFQSHSAVLSNLASVWGFNKWASVINVIERSIIDDALAVGVEVAAPSGHKHLIKKVVKALLVPAIEQLKLEAWKRDGYKLDEAIKRGRQHIVSLSHI